MSGGKLKIKRLRQKIAQRLRAFVSADAPAEYLVVRSVGLAYLQIPKAACTSVQALLLAYHDRERYSRMITDLESDPHPLHHTPGLLERSSDTLGCLRFTFVRHPFDRLVSFYLQAIRRADQDRHPELLPRACFRARFSHDAPLEISQLGKPPPRAGSFQDSLMTRANQVSQSKSQKQHGCLPRH